MAATTAIAFDTVYGVQEADICNLALARIGADRIRDTLETTKQANALRAIYAATRDELLRMGQPWNFAMRTDLILQDIVYPYNLEDGDYAYIADDRFVLTGGAAISTATISGLTTITLGQEYIGRMVLGTNIADNSTIIAVNNTAHTMTMDRPSTGTASGMYCYIPLLKVLQVNYDNDAMFRTAGGGSEKRIITSSITGKYNSTTMLLAVKYLRTVLNPTLFDPNFRDALVLRLASKVCLFMTRSTSLVNQIESEFAVIMRTASLTASEERVVDKVVGFWTDRKLGAAPNPRDM